MGHGSSVHRSKGPHAVPATINAAVRFKRGLKQDENGEASASDLTVTGSNNSQSTRYIDM